MSLQRYKLAPSVREAVIFEHELPLASEINAARSLANRILLGDVGAVAEAIELIRLECATRCSLNFVKRGKQLAISAERPSAVPELPAGYGYKGGAARCVLAYVLGREGYFLAPRDLDVVRFGKSWTELDATVSKHFMAEDFARGHGVELLRSSSYYFNSRDLTVNEILYFEGELLVSIVGLLDLLGLLLRPCRFLSGSLSKKPELRGSTLVKMLRLRAESLTAGVSWVLAGVTEEVVISDLELAVQLEKALSRGVDVGERFFALGRELGLFGAEIRTLGQLKSDLALVLPSSS